MYNADFSRKGLSGNCWGKVHSLIKCIGLVIFSLCHTYRIDEILRFAQHCILVMFNHSTLAGHYDIILIPLVDIKTCINNPLQHYVLPKPDMQNAPWSLYEYQLIISPHECDHVLSSHRNVVQ